MNILRILANGANSIADSYVNPRVYERPTAYGFAQDQAQLRQDVATVGNDMKESIKKNGRSHNSSSRK